MPFQQPKFVSALGLLTRSSAANLFEVIYHFDIHLLVSEPPRVASRLSFDCTPKGILFGLRVNGKRVSFTENVFYEFSRRTDRESMVGHRQGRYRISALGLTSFDPLSLARLLSGELFTL